MKRILFFATCLLLSVCGWAGVPEDLLAKHQAGETYSTDFQEVKTMPKANRTTTKHGRLTFTNPSYLRMDYTDPKGDYTLFDTHVFDRMKDGKLTHVPAKKGNQYDQFRAMLLACFCGDCEAVARQNKAKAVYSQDAKSISVEIRSEQARAYSLSLTYDAASGRLTQLVLIEPNGNYTTYSVR